MQMPIAALLCILAQTGNKPADLPFASQKQAAVDAVDALAPDIRRTARTLWDLSETALKETRSAKLLIDMLEKDGFTVRRGVAGMPTAFIASYGSGKPIIGVLAEYDALPGVGNEPTPKRQPRKDGVTNGQGCGHNLFGAASVGGAIALKRVMAERKIPGTLRLYGCPAEETVVGKVYMAKAGVFDDLDAAIHWHPGDENKTGNEPSLAMNNFTVEFFGKSAHGAADPWNGRSALDAVELMNHAANMMREHIKPTARIHYVIVNGGEAPNVVPAYARVWYYVRDLNREAVESHYQRLLKAAEGAALATGTTHKVTLTTGVHATLLIRPLQERLQRNLTWIGPPAFTEADQQFAKSLQRSLGIEADGFRTEIEPLADKPVPTKRGSTDVAEVSRLAPTIGFRVVTAAAEIPWHSWSATACHGTEAGYKAAVIAAKVIAATGIDLLRDDGLRKAAKADFDKKTGGKPYASPIPKDQKAPLPGD